MFVVMEPGNCVGCTENNVQIPTHEENAQHSLESSLIHVCAHACAFVLDIDVIIPVVIVRFSIIVKSSLYSPKSDIKNT